MMMSTTKAGLSSPQRSLSVYWAEVNAVTHGCTRCWEWGVVEGSLLNETFKHPHKAQRAPEERQESVQAEKQENGKIPPSKHVALTTVTNSQQPCLPALEPHKSCPLSCDWGGAHRALPLIYWSICSTDLFKREGEMVSNRVPTAEPFGSK